MKFLGVIIIAFIVSLFAGLGLYKYPLPIKKIVIFIIGFVLVCGVVFVIVFSIFKDLKIDGKTVFEGAAPIIGYIIGMLIGIGTNNKQKTNDNE
jgi:hypothetical protein